MMQSYLDRPKTPAAEKAISRLEDSLLEEDRLYEGHELFKTVVHRLHSRKQEEDSYALAMEGAILELLHGHIHYGTELALLLVHMYDSDATPASELTMKSIYHIFIAFPRVIQGDDEHPPIESCSKFTSATLKWLNKVHGLRFAPSVHGAFAAYIMRYLGWSGLGVALVHYEKSSYLEGHCPSFAKAVFESTKRARPDEEDLFICRAALQVAGSRSYPEQPTAVERATAFLVDYAKTAGHALPSTPLVHFVDLFLEALEKRSVPLVEILVREYKPCLDGKDESLWDLVKRCRDVHNLQLPDRGMPGAFGDLMRSMLSPQT